jgi:FeS assembly protein IscX
MADPLMWRDAQEIGIELYEAHEDVNPLSVSFVKLHKWVTELDGFADDPKTSNEKTLEAIQMIWLDEWKVDNE